MENRWGARTKIFREVYVYHLHQLVIRCISGNISPAGIFIKSGASLYTKNTRLNVHFTLEGVHGARLFRIPAVVTHAARDGLGLMFMHDHAETPRTIKSLLCNMPIDAPKHTPQYASLAAEGRN